MPGTSGKAAVRTKNPDVVAELKDVVSHLSIVDPNFISCFPNADDDDIFDSFKNSDVDQSLVDEITDANHEETDGAN